MCALRGIFITKLKMLQKVHFVTLTRKAPENQEWQTALIT